MYERLKARLSRERASSEIPVELSAEFQDVRTKTSVYRLKLGAVCVMLYCLADMFMPGPSGRLPFPGGMVASLLFAVSLLHLALLSHGGTDKTPVRRALCYSYVVCLCAVAVMSVANAVSIGEYPIQFMLAVVLLAAVPGLRPRVVIPLAAALYAATLALVAHVNPWSLYETYNFAVHATLLLAVAAVASAVSFRSDARVFLAARQMSSLYQELNDMATHDELTKLCNRRAFEAYFPEAIRQCRRDQAELCVVMLDVDCFKAYNVDFGHLEGDKALFKVAECMRLTFRRETDFAARFGGEEFIIIARMNGDDARDAIQTLLNRVEAMNLPNPRSAAAPHLTISAGLVSFVPTPEDTRESILTAADEALYEAKETGRNRVVSRSLPPHTDYS